MVNRQKEEPASWTIWHEEEQPDANGTGRRWRLKCSICLCELEAALVFPEHGLRLCGSCLQAIYSNAMENKIVQTNVPSAHASAGKPSNSVVLPSRDDSPKQGGEG